METKEKTTKRAFPVRLSLQIKDYTGKLMMKLVFELRLFFRKWVKEQREDLANSQNGSTVARYISAFLSLTLQPTNLVHLCSFGLIWLHHNGW